MSMFTQRVYKQKYTLNPQADNNTFAAGANRFGQKIMQKFVGPYANSMKHVKNYNCNTDLEMIDQQSGLAATRGKKRKMFINRETPVKKSWQEQNGVANPAFDPFYNNNMVTARHVLNTIQENENEIEEIAPKKHKKQNVISHVEVIARKQQKQTIEKKQKQHEYVEVIKPKKQKQSDGLFTHVKEIAMKKKKQNRKSGLENPNFVLNDDINESGIAVLNNTESLEVKRKSKKKKRVNVEEQEEVGIVNTALDLNESNVNESPMNNVLEVKRKNKKVQASGLVNPAFKTSPNCNISDGDIMLNVINEPVIQKQQKNELFEINSKIIQNNNLNTKHGHINRAFNGRTVRIQDRMRYARRTIENCQAEVENEVNEEKKYRYPTVGENSSQDGENEKLVDGTKLKFKYAAFTQNTPWYHIKAEGPKKSYKHLIKGDVVLAFKNTNLHEVRGYGAEHEMQKAKSKASNLAQKTAVVKPTQKPRKRITYVIKRRAPINTFLKPFRQNHLPQQNQHFSQTQHFPQQCEQTQYYPNRQNHFPRTRRHQQNFQQLNFEENQEYYPENQQEYFPEHQQEYWHQQNDQNFSENQHEYYSQQQGYFPEKQRPVNYEENEYFPGEQQQHFQQQDNQYFPENQEEYYPQEQQQYFPQQNFSQQQEQEYNPVQPAPVMQHRPKLLVKRRQTGNFARRPMATRHFQNKRFVGHRMNQAPIQYYQQNRETYV